MRLLSFISVRYSSSCIDGLFKLSVHIFFELNLVSKHCSDIQNFLKIYVLLNDILFLFIWNFTLQIYERIYLSFWCRCSISYNFIADWNLALNVIMMYFTLYWRYFHSILFICYAKCIILSVIHLLSMTKIPGRPQKLIH